MDLQYGRVFSLQEERQKVWAALHLYFSVDTRALKSGEVSEAQFVAASQKFNQINEELRLIQKQGSQEVGSFVEELLGLEKVIFVKIKSAVKGMREKMQKCEEEEGLEESYFKLKEMVEEREGRLKVLMEDETEAIESINDLISEKKQ